MIEGRFVGLEVLNIRIIFRVEGMIFRSGIFWGEKFICLRF